MDDRFSSVTRDHRFRPIRQTQRKVQIDKRFHGIFFNKNFRENFTVDKRGRPLQETNAKNLRKYYHLSNKERKRILKERRKDVQRKEELLNRQESETINKDAGEKTTEVDLEKEENEKHDDDSDSDFISSDEDEIDLARGKGNMESSSEDEFELDNDDLPDHKWGEMDNNAPRSEETSHRLALCGMDWDRISASDIFVLLQSFKPTEGTMKSVTIYPSEYGIARLAEEERSGPAELKQMRDDENEQEWSKDDDESFNTEKLRQYQLNRLKYYYAVVVCDSIATAENIYNECDGLEFETSSAKLDLRFIPDGMEFDDQPPKQQVTSMPDPVTYKPAPFITQALNLTKVDLTWDETDHRRTAITKSKISKDELENLDVKDFLASGSESEDDDIVGDINSKLDDKERAEMYRKLLLEECKKSDDEDIDMEITWEPDLKSTVENEFNPTAAKKSKKSTTSQEKTDTEQASQAELEMIMMSDDRGENEKEFELKVDDDRFLALYNTSTYAIDQSHSSFKKSVGMKKILDERQTRLKRMPDYGSSAVMDEKKSKTNKDLVANLVKSVKQKSIRLAKKSKAIK